MSSPRRIRVKPQASFSARATLLAALLAAATLTAHATLPEWLQHVVGASSVEAALYRAMALPSVEAMYPRPPREAETELARLLAATPNDAELHALCARSEEAALDFPAAEADWQQAAAHAKDPVAAQLQLADFYARRRLVPQELAALQLVASAPPIAAERFVAASGQRSWLASLRMLALAADQGLPAQRSAGIFDAFLLRYPAEPLVYGEFIEWQLSERDWPAAEALIFRYEKAFPRDAVFPVRAHVLLQYRRGNIDAALAVYDRAFQPLWPAELVQYYFGLLEATHRQRAFVAAARARLAAQPDGPEALNALARVFFYDQQAGRLDKAQATLDAFRVSREARNGAWTPLDLYTLATLTDSTHSYAESARYNYALASTPGALPGGEPAAQTGLSNLIHLLLTAPDQPIALGSGNLSLYRDIATLDQGPGYWNGILSLWLNGTSPEREYDAETAKAQSYFHRSKAADLLAELDRRFPAAPTRAARHAELIRAYAQYGEASEVVASGKAFLAEFPASSAPASDDRTDIAGLMADAYARQGNADEEFALYDALLKELAAKSNGLPLTAGRTAPASQPVDGPYPGPINNPEGASAVSDFVHPPTQAAAAMQSASFELTSYTPHSAVLPEAVQYAKLLDRYLGRLVAEGRLPQALLVLRHQLDTNPDDPLLYERLAGFLLQNNLSAQQEEVYKLAIARFQQPTWYDKLARVYLRERNREAYTALTRQVVDIFSGTELDAWFRNAGSLNGFNVQAQTPVGPQLAVQLNLYAQRRFPHDLVFTRNLLAAYNSNPTLNAAAYESLLRHHWWEDDGLRNEFFTFLSRTGKLDAELAQLETLAPREGTQTNPAATRELAEVNVWTSHFEQAAPLMGSVADLYPADAGVGDAAVSLFRSLAYLDPSAKSTARAVAIAERLSSSDPADPDRLATLGDLYAEATSTGGEDLRSAAPYWRRIPALHPGTPVGYLTSATVFWDYFQFDDALAEINAARTRFRQPSLYGYEAGAIAENRHDLPTAVAEYTAVVTHPVDVRTEVQTIWAAVDAWRKPPSDAADSNLRSTVQGMCNGCAANGRLLELAKRPASRALVDQASAKAIEAEPTSLAALNLRADVLLAGKREAELTPLLDGALLKAQTFDEAANIGALAQRHMLTPVYERALGKQVALSSDPVATMELQYALSSSLEGRKQVAAAARIIDAVYHANPRVLGVVRATTDFYVRTGQPPRAIATLLEAAQAATPELARRFTLEAAQRGNDSGDTRQARALAEPLLRSTPYDPVVLGIIAASYARSGDDSGLKQFYLAQLAAVRNATLTPEERKADTALLRRGLIPALTRSHDYAGAVAQYIALLSAYPEDSGTANEAALYALRYSRQAQLVDFLRDTVKQSPSDSRFAVLLAEVDTTFADLPAALAAYGQAIAIRKDRADLYSARVDLELRLAASDPARAEPAAAALAANLASDFERLYLLSYKDPAWMVRLAELRAREGRPAEAVKALETAYTAGHPPLAADRFRIAAQLTQWNLLAEARTAAEQGMELAGPDLLTARNAGGAATYARVMARLGKPSEALNLLLAHRRSVDADHSYPPQLAAQLSAAGANAKAVAEQRASYLAARRSAAHAEVDSAVRAIGEVVSTYSTPEAKLAYAQALDRIHDAPQPNVPQPNVPQRNVPQPNGDAELAIAAATSAGLADREAEWRRQSLLTGPRDLQTAPVYARYAALERRRLAFAELAQTFEQLAARVRPEERTAIRIEAAQAWRDAGDDTNELRLTRSMALAASPALRDRFFDLLLRHDRAALVALAGNRDGTLADAAASYAVAHATEAQALNAIAQRGRTLPAVWRPATASLALTYFASPTLQRAPDLALNFTEPLRTEASIADRLAKPADPARNLTCDNWFSYASRFGVFLATVPRAAALPDPEDFLPAELEAAPTAPAPYLRLARSYADAHNDPASIAEYLHSLELAPNNPAVHDELALVLFHANRRDDALAEWRLALDLLRRRQNGEAFFDAFKSVVTHLAARSLFATLRADIEAVLQPYFARNGNYRSNELLEAVYTASATPAEGTALILKLANQATSPIQVLEDLRRATWIVPASRETILLREIELTRNTADGDAESGPAGMVGYQGDLVELYLNENQLAKAQALLASIPAAATRPRSFEMYRILLAVRTAGALQPLLTRWRNEPDTIPSDTDFNSALYRLRRKTDAYTPDPAAIRPLEEFVFSQKQLRNTLVPTDFLALAQSRLDTHDLPGALELLHRLTLQPTSTYENGRLDLHPADIGAEYEMLHGEPADIAYGGDAASRNPYTNTDYAAALLEASHHPAEAVPFLAALVRAVPWNAEYRVRLAEAERDTAAETSKAPALLLDIVRDPAAPYATRVRAASDLAGLTRPLAAADAGSAELALLTSSPTPTPQSARQPYFAAARLASARSEALARPDRIALFREALAIAPNAASSNRALVNLLLLEGDSGSPGTVIAILQAIANAPTPATSAANADDASPGDETEPGSDAGADANSEAGAEQGPDEPSAVGPAVVPASLPAQIVADTDAPTRIRVANLLASAYQRDGNPRQSLSFLLLAQQLAAPAAKPDPALSRRIADLGAALRLERLNAARRPAIHAALDQSINVRPRLTLADLARAEAP